MFLIKIISYFQKKHKLITINMEVLILVRSKARAIDWFIANLKTKGFLLWPPDPAVGEF
jgi:hypothetical protein